MTNTVSNPTRDLRTSVHLGDKCFNKSEKWRESSLTSLDMTYRSGADGIYMRLYLYSFCQTTIPGALIFLTYILLQEVNSWTLFANNVFINQNQSLIMLASAPAALLIN